MLTREEVNEKMDYYYDKLISKDNNSSKRKYSYNCMLYLYSTYDFLKEIWEHNADNFKIVTRFAKKVVNAVKEKARHSKYDDIITNFTNWDICDKDGIEKCYLFKFFR